MKTLKVLAIILLGMTAAMNLLGGAGTFCAAFSNNVGYRMAFKAIMDYRWIYQIVMVTTILTGIAGVMALVNLIKGKPGVYRFTMNVLIIGTLLGGTQFFASMILRGKATPANVKFFTNLATLVFFLILRLPGIKDKIDFSQPMEKSEKNSAAGLVSILVGITTLTIFAWAGPSHTFFGENWVFVFEWPLVVIGTVLIVGGFLTVLRAMINIFSEQVTTQEHKI
jgi:TRAP-type C4-dicarboxylate transport system permease small subunit